MSSLGRVTGGSARFSSSATAKEMLPTLPQYIRNTTINRLTGSRSLVIPIVIPAVPMAENVSKSTWVNSAGWMAQIATAHKLEHTTYYNHLAAWVRRCETAEALAAITYGTALPQDLEDNMGAILLAAGEANV